MGYHQIDFFVFLFVQEICKEDFTDFHIYTHDYTFDVGLWVAI